MQIRYVIKLKKPILVEDHWPVPFMGGQLRMIATGKEANGLEIVFSGQPVTSAPSGIHHPITGQLTIKRRDEVFLVVRSLLESAFAFIQCYFDVEIAINRVEVHFTAETDEEKPKITIHSMSMDKPYHPPSISFDYFTRAVMAAEHSGGPQFEATLVIAARHALEQDKYIDSFRYSFLLMEALYGGGKFKNAQLKDALRANAGFVAMVATALRQLLPKKHKKLSDTDTLLASKATPESVIDHLVDKRGFYFHGNVLHKNAWKPHDQSGAETLALIAIEIVMLISHEAAAPMFAADFAKRHFENAKKVGAIMSLKVDFQFREPDETADKAGSITMNVPGTKVTPKMAQYVAAQFLSQFEYNTPVAALRRATCTAKDTAEKVFEMTFYPKVEEADEVTSQ